MAAGDETPHHFEGKNVMMCCVAAGIAEAKMGGAFSVQVEAKPADRADCKPDGVMFEHDVNGKRVAKVACEFAYAQTQRQLDARAADLLKAGYEAVLGISAQYFRPDDLPDEDGDEPIKLRATLYRPSVPNVCVDFGEDVVGHTVNGIPAVSSLSLPAAAAPPSLEEEVSVAGEPLSAEAVAAEADISVDAAGITSVLIKSSEGIGSAFAVSLYASQVASLLSRAEWYDRLPLLPLLADTHGTLQACLSAQQDCELATAAASTLGFQPIRGAPADTTELCRRIEIPLAGAAGSPHGVISRSQLFHIPLDPIRETVCRSLRRMNPPNFDPVGLVTQGRDIKRQIESIEKDLRNCRDRAIAFIFIFFLSSPSRCSCSSALLVQHD